MKEAQRVGPHCPFSRHTAARGPRREMSPIARSPSSIWVTGSLPWTIAVRTRAGPWRMALCRALQSSARCTRGR